MERINLTPKDEKVLPLTINGKDIDIMFNAGDMNVTATILAMADELSEYQKRATRLKMDENGKTSSTVQIKDIRKFADEGVRMCHSFSERMGIVSPEWTAVVGDNFIPLNVYERIIFALAQLISERKAEVDVAKRMEDER